MFGIGIPELILIAIVALIVVGPKDLPVTLRAIGRAIREFQRASRELRKEAGFDEVVDEVTRPLREGLAGIEADVLREHEDTRYEYPDAGPDDYDALPEGANVYPDLESEQPALEQPPAATGSRPAPLGTISRKSSGFSLETESPEPAGEAPLHEDPIIAAKLRAAAGQTPFDRDAIIAAKLAAVGATRSDDPIIAAKFASAPRGTSDDASGGAVDHRAIIAAKIQAASVRDAAIGAKLAALAAAPLPAPTALPAPTPAPVPTEAPTVEVQAEASVEAAPAPDETTTVNPAEEA